MTDVGAEELSVGLARVEESMVERVLWAAGDEQSRRERDVLTNAIREMPICRVNAHIHVVLRTTWWCVFLFGLCG